ncbi:MAG: type II toxin-antitoxin system HicA family toxin [Dehalococcoidia bacterium]|nr:type II toxin-antitoxin system HicA family toxin [Dehalococcoidia bacterium]
MTKLPPNLSGSEVVKALQRARFYIKRRKGSHIVLRRDRTFSKVVIPAHKIIDTGRLATILDGASLSGEDSTKLIK